MITVTTSMQRHAEAWAEQADLIDLQLSPLGLAAMDALAPAPGETVLDVGCGTGQTLMQLAERVGPAGRVIGVDIAARLLSIAQDRSAQLRQVTLRHHDAATLDLPAASVDAVYSRFGVMAFADPVAAFSNFRRMIRRGGRIGFVCWRALHENELDLLPLHAAGFDSAVDEAPFSFARTDYVSGVLRSAGFGGIAIRAFDASVSCGDVEATVKILTKVGALGKILRETPSLLADALPRVRSALVARADGGSNVALDAATWIVTATAE